MIGPYQVVMIVVFAALAVGDWFIRRAERKRCGLRVVD
jgi:hypothetical protein